MIFAYPQILMLDPLAPNRTHVQVELLRRAALYQKHSYRTNSSGHQRRITARMAGLRSPILRRSGAGSIWFELGSSSVHFEEVT